MSRVSTYADPIPEARHGAVGADVVAVMKVVPAGGVQVVVQFSSHL